MADRVEMGFAHDSGVAKSSRAGTKRKVNARPINLGMPVLMGAGPRIHTLRKPFLRSTVVNVAVVMSDSASMVDESSGGSAGVVISKPGFLS